MLLTGSTSFAQVAVTTFHNDNARTGANIHEGVLTPANVNSSSFGLLFPQSITTSDYANLVQQAFNDSAAANSWNTHATNMKNGLLSFWNPSTNSWATNKATDGTLAQANLTNWYPDAVAQIFPIVFGVVQPNDTKAVNGYASLNAAVPCWDKFNYNDPFPWAIVGYAAALMGDAARSNQYQLSVESKYVNVSPQFPWPWFDEEDGWFMKMLARTTIL